MQIGHGKNRQKQRVATLQSLGKFNKDGWPGRSLPGSVPFCPVLSRFVPFCPLLSPFVPFCLRSVAYFCELGADRQSLAAFTLEFSAEIGNANGRKNAHLESFEHFLFELLVCFGFRISSFGFPMQMVGRRMSTRKRRVPARRPCCARCPPPNEIS